MHKISNFIYMAGPMRSIPQDIKNGIALGTGIGTIGGIGAGTALNIYTKNKNTPQDEARKHLLLGDQASNAMQDYLDNEETLMNNYGKPWQGQALAAGSIIGGGLLGGLIASKYRKG